MCSSALISHFVSLNWCLFHTANLMTMCTSAPISHLCIPQLKPISHSQPHHNVFFCPHISLCIPQLKPLSHSQPHHNVYFCPHISFMYPSTEAYFTQPTSSQCVLLPSYLTLYPSTEASFTQPTSSQCVLLPPYLIYVSINWGLFHTANLITMCTSAPISHLCIHQLRPISHSQPHHNVFFCPHISLCIPQLKPLSHSQPHHNVYFCPHISFMYPSTEAYFTHPTSSQCVLLPPYLIYVSPNWSLFHTANLITMCSSAPISYFVSLNWSLFHTANLIIMCSSAPISHLCIPQRNPISHSQPHHNVFFCPHISLCIPQLKPLSHSQPHHNVFFCPHISLCILMIDLFRMWIRIPLNTPGVNLSWSLAPIWGESQRWCVKQGWLCFWLIWFVSCYCRVFIHVSVCVFSAYWGFSVSVYISLVDMSKLALSVWRSCSCPPELVFASHFLIT